MEVSEFTWDDAIEKIKQVKQERDEYREALQDALWMLERDSYTRGEIKEAIRTELERE